MKIFRCEQIKEIDRLTIVNEPVTSIDLMERAAEQVLKWCFKNIDRSRRIIIIAGPGNNGGDGLALARMLHESRYMAEVHYIKFTDRTTGDWNINRQRLERDTPVPFNIITNIQELPFISPEDIVIDALFGSGLTRPADGLAAEVIKSINRTGCMVISIDIPSGLFGEDNSGNDPNSIIRATVTLSFQFPKLSFLFAENAKYTGEWIVLPIGLNKTAIAETKTPFSLIETNFVHSLLKKRNRFDHKGVYGHALLAAGSSGKMGAAVLAAKAALRTGLGLLTCHIPNHGNQIVQITVPEAMTHCDVSETIITEIGGTETFDAVGIGPGIGIDNATRKAFNTLLLNRKSPIVIDADGLNILGLDKKWLSAIPAGTVLTPHVREFERIAGRSDNGYAQIEKQLGFANTHKCIIVLKGAYTSIATPDGELFFNSTGNPGMATAGSGDVLTGMILSLLAQGYNPKNAAITGVFLHGLAGDIAAGAKGYEAVIASDIIENIGNAFLKIRSLE